VTDAPPEGDADLAAQDDGEVRVGLADLGLPRWQERLLVAAAILTIPVAIVQHAASDAAVRDTAHVIDFFTWVVFVLILVLRARQSGQGWRWTTKHPFDVAVAVFSLPLFPLPMQLLRGLWLFGLLRVHGFARRIFSGTTIRYTVIVLVLAVVGGGSLFAELEHTDVFIGVYWAVTTVTTVGYGDISPTTDGGRVLAMVVMIIGVVAVGFLTAAAAERFMARLRPDEEPAVAPEILTIMDRLDDIASRLDGIERRVGPADDRS
jgi:voltage-gated potassium channel